MKRWTRWLPFWVVERMARQHCERFPGIGLEDRVFCCPYAGVLIDIGENSTGDENPELELSDNLVDGVAEFCERFLSDGADKERAD